MNLRTLDTVPVAILAGGTATRLGQVAADLPKALVDVAGRPFIAHQLALLYDRGFRRVVLCVGHLGHRIESVLGDGHSFGLQIDYSYDGATLMGTGGALRRAAPLLGDVFWVLYGDAYLDIDYRAIQAAFDRSEARALMTVMRNDNQWDRSNVEFADGELVRYDKVHRTSAMHHIDFGASILSRDVLMQIPEHAPGDLASLYASLIADGVMMGYEVTERFYEVGSHAGLADTRRYFSERQRHA